MSLKMLPAILLVAVLAGCTAVDPVVPSPSATETPTPTVSALPGSTVPLACGDLFSDAEASAIAGQEVVAVDSGMLLNSDFMVAAAQAGLLSCAWNPPTETDIYFGYAVSVAIIANADADFAARQVYDGDECSIYGTGFQCASQVLVNGYWARFSSMSRTVGSDSGLTLDALTATWAGVKDKIGAALADAGDPLEPWVAPAGTFTGAYCDTRDPGQQQPNSSPDEAAAKRILRSCSAGVADWTVAIVPGGAWALPIMAQSLPPAGKEVGNWTPIDVPGTDLALRACGEVCIVLVSVGGSAVSVSSGLLIDTTPPQDDIPFDDDARAMLAEVIAAG